MGLPVREVQRVCGLGLAVMMVAFPVTFRHGITDWAQAEARREMAAVERSTGPLWQPASTVPEPGHPAVPLNPPTVSAAVPHVSR
jgi:hypothetical protein